MNKTTILVDVREDIRNGREPFSKVMTAAADLREGQQLLLVAPFEPRPLVSVLGKQGFRHTAKANQAGDWEVLFVREEVSGTRDHAKTANSHHQTNAKEIAVNEMIDLDARGLEPPLPMIKILEAVATLPAGAELRGRTDRRPLHLYAQLEERGFASRTVEQADGTFLTHIRRA